MHSCDPCIYMVYRNLSFRTLTPHFLLFGTLQADRHGHPKKVIFWTYEDNEELRQDKKDGGRNQCKYKFAVYHLEISFFVKTESNSDVCPLLQQLFAYLMQKDKEREEQPAALETQPISSPSSSSPSLRLRSPIKKAKRDRIRQLSSFFRTSRQEDGGMVAMGIPEESTTMTRNSSGPNESNENATLSIKMSPFNTSHVAKGKRREFTSESHNFESDESEVWRIHEVSLRRVICCPYIHGMFTIVYIPKTLIGQTACW